MRPRHKSPSNQLKQSSSTELSFSQSWVVENPWVTCTCGKLLIITRKIQERETFPQTKFRNSQCKVWTCEVMSCIFWYSNILYINILRKEFISCQSDWWSPVRAWPAVRGTGRRGSKMERMGTGLMISRPSLCSLCRTVSRATSHTVSHCTAAQHFNTVKSPPADHALLTLPVQSFVITLNNYLTLHWGWCS